MRRERIRRSVRARLLLALVPLLVAGCLEGAGGDDPGSAVEEVPFRSLTHDTDSGIKGMQRVVLDTQAAYEAQWARHAESPNPKGAPPAVDFATERVALVALGEKGSGCHDIRVENVTRAGGRVVVHVAIFDGEAPGYGCTANMVQPIHFVAFRDHDGVVEFEERTVRPPEPWPSGDGDPQEAEPLSTRTLARGTFSGIHEDTRVLLGDQALFDALWARHARDGDAPFVEFPNESVVAVVVHGPTGCAAIHVGNVTYDGNAITVEVVRERSPPEVNCFVAFEDAYHFVAIPDRPGDARFVEVEGEALPTPAPGSGPPRPTPTPSPDAPYDHAFRTLDVGASSGVHEKVRRVLTTEAEWRAFHAEHTSNVEPKPALPPVDFAKERVFVATAGDKPNTCWALRVERIEVQADVVKVHVVTYPPPEGALCGFAISQPHHFVTYPVTDKPHVVVETERSGPPRES